MMNTINTKKHIYLYCSGNIALTTVIFVWAAFSIIADGAKSVTQYGITWFFYSDYTVGQYANGDYWVVGPIKITNITPISNTDTSGWTRNGTMVNPAVGPVQGYDSSIRFTGASWNQSLNVAPAFTGAVLSVPVDTSVVSTVSNSTPGVSGTRPQLTDAAILTVVATAPQPGSFRPPAVGSDKTHRWNKNALKFSILQKLLPVASTPPLAIVEQYFARPWFTQMEGSPGRYIAPYNHMPEYGRDQAQQLSLGLLSLHLNYTDQQKERLYVLLVQYGIDIYGAVRNGMIYLDYGGLNAGRKAPLVLAGLALADEEILKYADAKRHFIFQEDRTTWFVAPSDVGRVMYQGDGRPRETYIQSHVGMPEWGESHTKQINRDASNWASAYYRWIGGAWHGNILAIRLTTGGEAAWNHPPLFSYADRYWSIEGARGQSGQNFAGQNSISPFVYQMWSAYRGASPPVTTGKVNTPRFMPIPGCYDGPQLVGIYCDTDSATIRYTTDGTEPTLDNNVYTQPILVKSDTRITARAYVSGREDSASASGTYNLISTPPTISPNGMNVSPRAGNLFAMPLVVSISCMTERASIYYTTNGLTPTQDSKIYNGPFDLAKELKYATKADGLFESNEVISSIIIKAISSKPGLGDSPVQEAIFNFGPFSSGDDWLNIEISPRANFPGDTHFSMLIDYVPADSFIDSVLGLSSKIAQNYTDLFCIVRFNSNGLIDARNGSAYMAENDVRYDKGFRYRIELNVDMDKRVYSARVSSNVKRDVIENYVYIAKDYSFRTEQSSVTHVENLALYTIGNSVSQVMVLANRLDSNLKLDRDILELDWSKKNSK